MTDTLKRAQARYGKLVDHLADLSRNLVANQAATSAKYGVPFTELAATVQIPEPKVRQFCLQQLGLSTLPDDPRRLIIPRKIHRYKAGRRSNPHARWVLTQQPLSAPELWDLWRAQQAEVDDE